MSLALRLVREPSISRATLGVLFTDGAFQCFTCEDEVREIVGQSVSTWKIPGRTAIPVGTYKVIVSMSQRFHRPLPLLLDVPGFDGIRIHPGNTAADTAGCVLPGLVRGSASVGGSRQAFDALFARIQASLAVTITIEPAWRVT